MSAFYSFAYADRVHLLTDAGYFDEVGNLVAIDKKVFTSASFPFAITGRGIDVAKVWSIISEMGSYVDGFAWYECVDDFLPFISTYFHQLGQREGSFDADFLIAAYSKEKGPVHFFIQCHGNYDCPSFELVSPGWQIAAGPPIEFGDLGHLKLAEEDILASDFPVRYGAEIMTAMRKRKSRIPGGGREIFGVGGRCDLTTVTSTGAVTTSLVDWGDTIGKPLMPLPEEAA